MGVPSNTLRKIRLLGAAPPPRRGDVPYFGKRQHCKKRIGSTSIPQQRAWGVARVSLSATCNLRSKANGRNYEIVTGDADCLWGCVWSLAQQRGTAKLSGRTYVATID